MKTGLSSLSAGVLILTICLLMGYQHVAAAPPTGEVKSAAIEYGNEIPIPYLETGHGDDWMQLVFDTLVGTTPDGKLSPDHGLANKWELSPDRLTWTFYLRKGVKFHDGVELTAKDVKFSIDQQRNPKGQGGAAAIEIRRIVKDVEVKDPYTVAVHLKMPNIFLGYLLSNVEGPAGCVVPKDYYEKVGEDGFAKRPIGSGPYKWRDHSVGSYIKLEATGKEHWRDGMPRYKYMTYLIVPEEITRLAMLKTGAVDIISIDRQRVKDVVDAGFKLITKENGAVFNYVINMQWTSPIFSDIRFRKALNLAIDKEKIIKQLLGGQAKPVATFPGSDITSVGGAPTLPPYPYDPKEAKRLIKEGGWEGHEFTLVVFPRFNFYELPNISEAIAGYWEQIGLKPKILRTEWGVFRQRWRSRKVENSIYGTDSTSVPGAAPLISRFMQRFYFKKEESCVNIPELNERFERIDKSLDLDEITKLLREIYRYTYDHYLSIPIAELSDIIAVNKEIPQWDPGRRRFSTNYYDLIRQR